MKRIQYLFGQCLWILLTGGLSLSVHAQAIDTDQLIANDANVKKLAGGFEFTEGPAVDSRGNICFSDIPNESIHRWSVEGTLSLVTDDSGGTNGLYFDAQGHLIGCETEKRRVTSRASDGKVTVIADRYDGKRFNKPNDLWIAPKGGIYFTDPHYGKGADSLEMDGMHVYYIAPDRQSVIRVADDLVKPNGVVGTPDGKMLYVADHRGNAIYRYTILPDGKLTDKHRFADRGSDGLTLDERGNLYATDRGVTAWNSAGEKILTVDTPEKPANLVFGGKDGKTLFITARKSLYAIRMNVRGALVSNAARAAGPVGTAHMYKKLGDRELTLYVTKPKDWTPSDRRPAIVFFHGGAWVAGKPGQFTEHSKYLASRGMVAVQVQYRLLDNDTKDPPEICVRDAKSAMRWVRSRAGMFGIDPDRIASAGGSAGGHLAAFVGMVDGRDDPDDDMSVSAKSNAMVLFNPVFDNGPEGWGYEHVGDRYKEFSPIHNVSDDDPPSIVFLGSADKLVPVRSAEDFQSRLRQAGVDCEVMIFEGKPHAFFNYGRDGNKPYFETVTATDQFLSKLGWLSGPPTLAKPSP